jgi:hypothetical protein
VDGLKRADLSESAEALAKAGEFPRAPAASTARCSKRRAGRQGAKRSETRSNRQIVSTRASLATPHGSTRRRFMDRLDDAQDTRDTGVFFCFCFLSRERK